jgi:hypothetical protein
MKVYPKIQATHAFFLKEDLIAPAGTWLVCGEANVAALTPEQFSLLYYTKEPDIEKTAEPACSALVPPVWPCPWPQDNYSYGGDSGYSTTIRIITERVLLAFGPDAQGQFTTLTSTKLAEWLKVERKKVQDCLFYLKTKGEIDSHGTGNRNAQKTYFLTSKGKEVAKALTKQLQPNGASDAPHISANS